MPYSQRGVPVCDDDSFLLDCNSKAPQILGIYWHMVSNFNPLGSWSSTESNLHKTKITETQKMKVNKKSFWRPQEHCSMNGANKVG